MDEELLNELFQFAIAEKYSQLSYRVSQEIFKHPELIERSDEIYPLALFLCPGLMKRISKTTLKEELRGIIDNAIVGVTKICLHSTIEYPSDWVE